MDRTDKSPEVVAYGRESFAQGYKMGYQKSTQDKVKISSTKEKSRYRRFSLFVDWLDDLITANKKK